MEKELNKEHFVQEILKSLNTNKDTISEQWQNPKGTSTKHFFLDKLLPQEYVDKIYSSFPKNGDNFFDRESFREKKKTSADLSKFDPILTDITYALQDPRVVDLISNICNLRMIEPDPMLYGSGLSIMNLNDYLNPHIDNSHDGERKKYRRMNLLFYVSPNWKIENGGNFELWNDDRSSPLTIVSEQNRLVVMETTRFSWHSVSKVRADRPRCCISNYYFSEESPHGTNYFHVTSFLGRPEEPFKKFLGVFDNLFRNIFSKSFKIGRGKHLMFKDKNK